MSSFLGTGWSFPPRFDRSAGRVAMVEDEQDIVEACAYSSARIAASACSSRNTASTCMTCCSTR